MTPRICTRPRPVVEGLKPLFYLQCDPTLTINIAFQVYKNNTLVLNFFENEGVGLILIYKCVLCEPLIMDYSILFIGMPLVRVLSSN